MRSLIQISLLAAVLGLAGAPAAQAQSGQAIDRKIEQLEKQIKALQRKVFDSNSRFFPEDQNGQVSPMVDQGGGGNLLADLQVRISDLERQLRELTGKVEEANYRNRQLAEDLRRFREDTEFRLGQLEHGGAADASPQGAMVGGNKPAAPDLGPTAAITDAPGAEQGGSSPKKAPVIKEKPQTPAQQAEETPPPPETDPDDLAAAGAAEQPAAPAAGQASSPKGVFDQAFAALRRGDYNAAEQGFNNFLSAYPDDPLSSNAQYWLGRTYYVRQDYAKAAGAFLKGYQDHPQGDKAADSLLDLGVSLIELGQPKDACGAFEQLKQSYPNASPRISRRLASESARAGCG